MRQTIDPPVLAFEEATVADVMHDGVLACPPETSLRVVARMMSHQRIHCIVVFGDPDNYTDGSPWRIVSDVDLVRSAGEGFGDRTAGDAAATPVVVVTPRDPLSEAAQRMTASHSTHAVVVDPASKQPVGILSTLDIAAALAFGH